MAAASTAVTIGYPTGQTTTNLYNWATSTASRLNQVLQAVGGGNVDVTQLQTDVTELQTQVADIQDQIDNLEANGDLTPQQAFELSLVTRADEIFGSYTALVAKQQTQMQQNADAVMQAAIQADKANTGVRTTVRVMNEQNLALAEQITQVSADLGVTNSNVTTLTQAVADGDSSLGAQITEVSSQVAGNTASITVLIESVDGVQNSFGVQLNAQGEITDVFRLDGTPQGTGAVFNVDNFKIGKAGTDGGAPINAFGISFVNGVPQIALRGQVISDGTILARMIQAGAITADKIAANSLSAISANLGTVTAGLIKNPAGTLIFDLPNMRLYRTDGKMDLNLNAGYFIMQS
jgi:hypothetical protein